MIDQRIEHLLKDFDDGLFLEYTLEDRPNHLGSTLVVGCGGSKEASNALKLDYSGGLTEKREPNAQERERC